MPVSDSYTPPIEVGHVLKDWRFVRFTIRGIGYTAFHSIPLSAELKQFTKLLASVSEANKRTPSWQEP